MALKRNRLNELHSLPSPPVLSPRSSAKNLPTSLPPRGALAPSAERGRMEQFHDGEHVWLRSRVRGTYLHADEDGRGVSLSSQRATRNAAWGVHVFYEDGLLLFLQGAAYGRYLAGTEAPAQLGHRGLRAEQRSFDEQEVESITWQAVKSGSGDDVLLLHVSSHGIRYLRANGRYVQWETGVTMEDMGNLSTMMHWVVEPIPRRDTMPPLPRPREPPGFLTVLLGRNVEVEQWREIRYVRAGPDGSVNENDWVAFQFAGRSVLNLRSELALRVGDTVVLNFGLTMCVRAGPYARLTPLVVDLPLNNDPLDIVILMDRTPAIQALRHPDVDATDED